MDFWSFEASLTLWMQTESGRPIGLAEIPGKDPNIPYAIFTPINSPRGDGDYKMTESHRDYVFQILCVGKSPRQARWMSDLMRNVLIGRDVTTGAYLHGINLPDVPDTTPPTPPGASVLPGSRYSDAVGSIVKTGDTVFQVVDTYRFKVA